MVMEEDQASGGQHTMQYTDDVLQNCIPETFSEYAHNDSNVNPELFQMFMGTLL